MIRRAVVIGVLISAIAGCGGDQESDPLGIGRIVAAVEAVRDETGTEPRFFEINSTADGVTLFLAASDTSSDGSQGVQQARFTDSVGLVLADEVLPASGPTFGVTGWEASPERLTAAVFAELPESTPLMFVMTAPSAGNSAATDEILFRILMESEMGGRLAIFVDSDGRILGTDVLE